MSEIKVDLTQKKKKTITNKHFFCFFYASIQVNFYLLFDTYVGKLTFFSQPFRVNLVFFSVFRGTMLDKNTVLYLENKENEF